MVTKSWGQSRRQEGFFIVVERRMEKANFLKFESGPWNLSIVIGVRVVSASDAQGLLGNQATRHS